MATKKNEKNEEIFNCSNCHYTCSYKCDWNRHQMTSKHKKATNAIKKNEKNEKNDCKIFNCSCGNNYKHKSSYYKHKKKCEIKCETTTDNIVVNTLINENKSLKEFMIEQNTDFKNIILEVCKNLQPSSTINTMNNSNNKTFNLQVFLNETCKDAMNIMDFVDSIKLQLSDLESVGELGYINGLSKIIIKNLKALDENMRPVHCSDLKRGKIYVKDANTWTKECPDNKILKNAIKYIAHKNVKMIPAFREKYPDCIYSESRKSDQYNRLIIEAMGGDGNDEDGKSNKIISKIAKEILIEK